MFIFIGLLVGLVFGYTSHIKQPLKQRFIGMARCFGCLGGKLGFYNLGLWWASVLWEQWSMPYFLWQHKNSSRRRAQGVKKTSSTIHPQPTHNCLSGNMDVHFVWLLSMATTTTTAVSPVITSEIFNIACYL